MVARIFCFSVPHIWLAQNHTEWRWIDIPIGQGPSKVPMWLAGLKKCNYYGSWSMQQDPVSYQFQSTCVFSVHTHKIVCVFLFGSSLWEPAHCMWLVLRYAAFFTSILLCYLPWVVDSKTVSTTFLGAPSAENNSKNLKHLYIGW